MACSQVHLLINILNAAGIGICIIGELKLGSDGHFLALPVIVAQVYRYVCGLGNEVISGFPMAHRFASSLRSYCQMHYILFLHLLEYGTDYRCRMLSIHRNAAHSTQYPAHLALDRPDPAADAAGVKYTPGFVHNVMYETYLKDHETPEDIKYFMCGPPMMVSSVNNLLDSLGVQPESILYDNFS